MKTPHYVSLVGEFNKTLNCRRDKRVLARQAVDAFIEKQYGIACFTHLVHTHLPLSAQAAMCRGQTIGLLARQVPGICAEDVAMYILCRKLGLFPLALSFTRDTFVTMNHDKRHRVKIPWVEWSKKNNRVVRFEDISTEGIVSIERRRLDSIPVKNASSLIEYHRSLRHQVFNGSYEMDDVSRFHGELLARATRNPPESVYREVNGKDRLVKGAYTPDEARALIVRPPSEWYYPLYLSMFATGEIVLLETYENPDGGVPEAKRLFEETMDGLARAYGWMPLVVQTAPLCLDMMFCNRHLLQTPGSVEKLCDQVVLSHETTHGASRHFADMAVMFRG